MRREGRGRKAETGGEFGKAGEVGKILRDQLSSENSRLIL